MGCAGSESCRNIVKEPNTWIYFAIYCLTFSFDGFTLGFPGAVYLELQQNLNASTFTLSWIYSTMAIGFMVASIGYGYSADHMKEIHRLHAPTIFINALCLIYVPYCTNTTVMFVLFALIGIGWAGNETNETLFVFRLFPMSGNKMIFWMFIIIVVFASLTPLFFEVSITYFHSIEYPFIIFGVIGILHSILVLFLKTPQHDELRSIKKNVAQNQAKSVVAMSTVANSEPNDVDVAALDEIAQTALMRLNETKNYKTLQNVSIILLMLMMMTEGCAQRGYTSFIATYCVDYLEISESWSRYYIVCLYSMYGAYRIVKSFLFPDFSVVIQVTVGGFVLRLLFAITFIFYGKGVVSLFVVYILIGLSGSPVLPGLITWGESITPTTGIISCSWWIFYGIGDATMSFTLGSLIEKYGAQIMPAAVSIALAIGLVFNICAVLTSNALKRAQTKVFAQTAIKIGDVSPDDDECETDLNVTKPPNAQ